MPATAASVPAAGVAQRADLARCELTVYTHYFRHQSLMPARFATFIEVLRDPAVNVDTFAHVEQRAISIEKSIDATAARQRIHWFTRLREGDVLRCFGHRAMVS